MNGRVRPTNERPLKIFAKDFDENGSVDNVIAGYSGDRLVPLHGLKDVKDQLNFMRKRFQKFDEYANASMAEFLTEEEMQDVFTLDAQVFESSVLMNEDDGFALINLPLRAQISPVYGIILEDLNDDVYPDIVLIGNKYGTERTTGKHDAGTGLVTLSDGNGSFSHLTPSQSGIYVPGDAKAIARMIDLDGTSKLVVSQNRGPLLVFERIYHPLTRIEEVPSGCQGYTLHYEDGKKEKREIYYGHGHASSGSNRIAIPRNVVNVEYILSKSGTVQ